MNCQCRNCKRKYVEGKSSADWKGYCSQRCLKEKARALGPLTNMRDGTTVYDILRAHREIGSVPWEEPVPVEQKQQQTTILDAVRQAILALPRDSEARQLLSQAETYLDFESRPQSESAAAGAIVLNPLSSVRKPARRDLHSVLSSLRNWCTQNECSLLAGYVDGAPAICVHDDGRNVPLGSVASVGHSLYTFARQPQ